MQELIPGFNVNTCDLFSSSICSTFADKIFNPFDRNSDINNICNTDDNHGDSEAWVPCSNILESCKYYEMREIPASRSTELKILSLNIRSISDKITSIRDDIGHYSKFDILCFNETCCSVDQLPFAGKELELEPFHPPVVQSPARSSNRGGGLIVYINRKLCSENDFRILDTLSENTDFENGEFLFLEISRSTRNKNIVIGNMYRSPSGNPGLFIDKLEQKLDLLKRHKNKLIILTSDSNIDLLKFDHHEPTNRLVNSLAENGFIPVISRPTRITSHSATVIDHIFVNNCTAVTKSGIVTVDLSDHLAPFVNILIDGDKFQIVEHERNWRQINDENLELFKKEISETDWNFLAETESADEKYTTFEQKYRESYEKCFPLKSRLKKKRKIDKPWCLPWLQGACDRKKNLFKTFVKKPTIENETKYKKLKKFVAKHVKKAKRTYYTNYFRRYSDDSRKQWAMINQLLNRKPKSKASINKLTDGEETVTSPRDIANRFNDFFCNVAQRLKQETGHLGDHGRPPDSTLNTSKRSHIIMPHTECTIVEIEKIISSLRNKATSDLAIQPLKFVSREIAPIIQHLVNTSLEQGIFPDLLKCAKVIPLHKSGSRTDVTNYRPISLLSCFSKIYEKVMHKRLINFLEENKILFESQYGFRALHSCEHALLEAQNYINLALDRKQIAVLLLIDFSKAFDMVDHDILLNKLEHYGIRGTMLAWFKSYLTGRQQYVHVNNINSDNLNLKYSVPQGSILGPVLFILYINDLPNISTAAKYIFFADDANIIITGNNYLEIQEKIDSLLVAIDKWVTLNGLKLNVKKTKFMIFSNRREGANGLDIRLNGVVLERVASERFLGVILESGLTWKIHISKLASKISRNAGILYKLKGLVPDNVLKTVYNSLIQSHLNYCSNVWGLGSKSSINRIFTAQKKAVRASENKFNNGFYNSETGELPCHTKEIFTRNKFLTVHNLIAKNCLAAMHKIYLNTSPTKISSLFQCNKPVLRNSRRDPQFFDIPKSRLFALDRTLTIKGPKLYNYVMNLLIKKQTSEYPERKFLDPFKRMVSGFLNTLQSKGGLEWEDENFTIYNF